jgi:DNA-binding NarL/FixJ family response regulator
MHTLILIDSDKVHAEGLAERLRARGLNVMRQAEPKSALSMLRRASTPCDLVLINVSNSSQPWLRTLRELQESGHSSSRSHPLVLCLSTGKKDPQFQLALERMGARFVYER